MLYGSHMLSLHAPRQAYQKYSISNGNISAKEFSAVATFFGKDSNETLEDETSDQIVTSRKNHRLGVGVVKKKSSDNQGNDSNFESEETKKNILRVGRNKKDHDNEEDFINLIC